MPGKTGHHDIIVIGASAGGLRPLQQILAALPADLPAAVFVVVHVGATSHLAEILDQCGPLPVHAAEGGAAVVPGHVYVAVPGCHLMMHDHHVLLRRGPRENLARPAVDPLFRSAACTFRSRVIGVVLSGRLNDGTAGLLAVKRCGGLAVVQQPADAAFTSMPASALRHVAIDRVASAGELGGVLALLVRELAPPPPPIPFEIRLETAIAAQELSSMRADDMLGKPSTFACPECHGVLWEIEDGGLLRFRCHVGHAYTAESVQASQAVHAETLLWNLLRNHRERAALTRRLADREEARANHVFARELRQRAHGYAEDGEIIRRLLDSRIPEAAEATTEQET